MKRIVLVTGGSRGIGKAIALKFAKAGDKVIINYLNNESAASSALEEMKSIGPGCILQKGDVSSSDDVKKIFAAVKEKYGRLDVLINNAGLGAGSLLVKTDAGDFSRMIDVNCKGPFLCIKEASKIMMKQKGAHIINVSSIVGVRGAFGQSSYAASKAGLIALSKSAARELGRYDIRVNTVLPGLVMTDMGKSSSEGYVERTKAESCLGGIGDVSEVADFAYNLSVTNDISGQVFNINSRII